MKKETNSRLSEDVKIAVLMKKDEDQINLKPKIFDPKAWSIENFEIGAGCVFQHLCGLSFNQPSTLNCDK